MSTRIKYVINANDDHYIFMEDSRRTRKKCSDQLMIKKIENKHLGNQKSEKRPELDHLQTWHGNLEPEVTIKYG